MRTGILYISYTGMLEPLGQSQVLAYQESVAAERPVHILSFERPADFADAVKLAQVRTRMAAAGIHWHPRVYHRRPSALATLWDIAVGGWVGIRLARRHQLGIVHARSYVASVMALAVRRFTGARFLFDMRGFWADERVDGGLWPRGGLMYRIAKRFERHFLQTADHVVSLTQAGVDEMQRFDYLQARRPPMTVIPTCADLTRFVPIEGQRDSARFTLGYVGSVGTWYHFEATAVAFRHLLLLRPESRLLIVNRGEHEIVRAQLQRAGIPPNRYELRSARHDEVPGLIARMDAAAFFYKPSFSRAACAPTRLGEFLGCGIPCLANTGVGDMATVLDGEGVGVAIQYLDEKSVHAGIEALLCLCSSPSLRGRCVEVARKYFSLDHGVARYRAVYQALERGS